MRPTPMILAILDGWGMRRETSHNAIHAAPTPHFDLWWRHRPHALVETCGEHVGLPDGQMGNSEVGHANLGAGRILYQDFTRIGLEVRENRLRDNPALTRTVAACVTAKGEVHLCGLLSPGGVHSHADHLLAGVRAAHELGTDAIHVHAFLDGRDVPPRSALEYLADFEARLAQLGAGRIASVCGRYWAMDRDQRWDRVARAYDMLTLGTGEQASDAASAVQAAYARGEDDEFVQPTVIPDGQGRIATVRDGDAILMMNFRADRMREINRALLDPLFTGFDRRVRPVLSGHLSLTEYDASLPGTVVAFPPQTLVNTLGETLAKAGLTQLRAAETEKYAHVTYFFNGGQEISFPGEERLLIPSPKVATYDSQPEMSAIPLTDRVVEAIASGRYDLIVVNYANPDMVGHTGNFAAALEAIRVVDLCLGRLAEAADKTGAEMLITADHGNADRMLGEDGQPHTAHTLSPAPLLHLGNRRIRLMDGRLCDVAPTLLWLMGLPQPEEMDGRSLAMLSPP
ncbi:MAG: 2,3-bisphosphoglycerate-independent phosphoglycerate mutase [Magnetococcales bacterium]|nr:2,3-bisphosphoglycerate-independent phosphoglycerate mutase [Magnetococcales bacterium]